MTRNMSDFTIMLFLPHFCIHFRRFIHFYVGLQHWRSQEKIGYVELEGKGFCLGGVDINVSIKVIPKRFLHENFLLSLIHNIKRCND